MSFHNFLELLQTDIPDGIAYLAIVVGGVVGGFALFALFF